MAIIMKRIGVIGILLLISVSCYGVWVYDNITDWNNDKRVYDNITSWVNKRIYDTLTEWDIRSNPPKMYIASANLVSFNWSNALWTRHSFIRRDKNTDINKNVIGFSHRVFDNITDWVSVP